MFDKFYQTETNLKITGSWSAVDVECRYSVEVFLNAVE